MKGREINALMYSLMYCVVVCYQNNEIAAKRGTREDTHGNLFITDGQLPERAKTYRDKATSQIKYANSVYKTYMPNAKQR